MIVAVSVDIMYLHTTGCWLKEPNKYFLSSCLTKVCQYFVVMNLQRWSLGGEPDFWLLHHRSENISWWVVIAPVELGEAIQKNNCDVDACDGGYATKKKIYMLQFLL